MDTNRRLGAERLIAELEFVITQGMETCLMLVDVMRPLPAAASTPECEFASAFFVLDETGVRFSSGSPEDTRRVSRDLVYHGTLVPTRVYPLRYADAPVAQFFYTQRSVGSQQYVIAATVNLKRFRDIYVPVMRKITGVNGTLADLNGNDILTNAAFDFHSVFPFWQVTVVPEPGMPPSAAVVADLRWFALLTGMALLGSLVFLMIGSRQYSHARQARIDFVNGAVHQLKMPLSTMRLYGTLQSDPRFGLEDRRRFAAVLASTAHEMAARIDVILDFERISRGERIYRLQPFSLADLIESFLERWRDYFNQHEVRIESGIEGQLPLVAIDPNSVSDALFNLLDNSRKYADLSHPVQIRSYAETERVVLEVRDRGPGIRDRDIPRIFQAFYRNAGNSGKGGFGLGLFLVRHIMEGHGGSVEVQSGPGEGTVFRLLFPLNAAHPSG